jgi:hypothetical protein
MEMSEMTGENGQNVKYIKGNGIMLLRTMQRKRQHINDALQDEDIRNNKQRNFIRIDIETRQTENQFTQNGDLVIRRLDDEEINSQDRDARRYYNEICWQMSESNMRETDREFDREQFKLCRELSLGYPRRKYDKRYKELYGDD